VRETEGKTLRRTLARGELVRLMYRLGRHAASGVLTLGAGHARPDVFVLRRGHAVIGDAELARKTFAARLARLAAEPEVAVVFEGGITAYPPGATHGVSLAGWARTHLEAQLDSTLAEALVQQLAGIRLSLRSELAPEPIDEADRRMLAALMSPRRLDQIWPLARTPRFRLLAFIHFLRAIDALEAEGIVAERSAPLRRPPPHDPQRVAAQRLLGIDDSADLDTVKRAYRRLARSLHPDLQPGIDLGRRRALERRFAEVTAAYEVLT